MSPDPELVLMEVEAGTAAAAVAVETCEDFVVGTPPERSGGFVDEDGTVQRARVTPLVHAAAVLTISVSVAERPESVEPSMKRFCVVLT